MITNRRTFVAHHGQSEAAIDLLRSEARTIDWPHGLRFYSDSITTFNTVVMEADYDNLAQYEAMWNEWFSRPTTPAFFEKWIQLTQTGGKNEIFELEIFK